MVGSNDATEGTAHPLGGHLEIGCDLVSEVVTEEVTQVAHVAGEVAEPLFGCRRRVHRRHLRLDRGETGGVGVDLIGCEVVRSGHYASPAMMAEMSPGTGGLLVISESWTVCAAPWLF